MSDRPEQYVTAAVAAAALEVGVDQVWRLARTEGWRMVPTRPRGFLLEDVKRTARARRDPKRAEDRKERARLERERRSEAMLRSYFDR
jgi:hypothetical protein